MVGPMREERSMIAGLPEVQPSGKRKTVQETAERFDNSEGHTRYTLGVQLFLRGDPHYIIGRLD